ncbi:MAG: glycosyltransferase family 4 protein [Verrucomicrobia bacterium]|nr:glycosyltransferase family 4 protein [Verrucomicrobiota bacterium]
MPPPPRSRLAVVVSHPTQYYSPWFAWLAAHAPLDLRVFYLWDFGVKAQRDPQFGRTFAWDRDLLAGYAHEFVPNRAHPPGTERFGGLDNPGLLPRLRAWAPGAVLMFGYNYRSHLRVVLRARWPLIFRGDSHLIDQPRPGLLKRVLLRALYARFAAITYVGQANRDYFRAFGVADARLHFAPHCVDAAHFTPTDALRARAAELRRQLDLGTRRVVLFAGKLVPAKQPLELLRAFQAIAPADAALVFVGEGGELSALQAAAAERPELPVRFLPFANQSEMPVRYLLADVFALPSAGLYETWGLAVNEAMHLGLPCLVSHRVGCQRDLVTDGETGWVFPATDQRALADTLARALGDVSTRAAQFRHAVTQRVAGYTFAQATNGLLSAVTAVATSR